jgi:hypothetical protein
MYTDTKLMRLEFLLFRLICVQNKVISLLFLHVPSVDPIMNNGWPDLLYLYLLAATDLTNSFFKFGLVGSIPFNLPQTRSPTPHTLRPLWLWPDGHRGVWLMWVCPEVSARARGRRDGEQATPLLRAPPPPPRPPPLYLQKPQQDPFI